MKALYILLGVLALVDFFIVLIYNRLFKGKATVSEAFSTMDVYFQKRYDLIPNLVATVKGYAKHEAETLAKVVELRNTAYKSASATDRVEGEKQLGLALSNLMAVAEQYPDLKANTQFTGLQTELSGIEEQIAQSRKYYNGAAKQLNVMTETFPTVIVAKMFGFKQVSYFEVEGTKQRENVKVEF
ncbi:MAG: LemA family protein [Oscillospiraceae bacterium]